MIINKITPVTALYITTTSLDNGTTATIHTSSVGNLDRNVVGMHGNEHVLIAAQLHSLVAQSIELLPLGSSNSVGAYGDKPDTIRSGLINSTGHRVDSNVYR